MTLLEKDFVPYQESLELKKLGFDEPCFGYHLTKDLPYVKRGLKFGSEKYVGKHNSYDDFIVSAPTFSQAFRWFREKYDMHVQIRKENYFYKNIHNNYFHFDISQGQQDDITGQQDLYSNIMDECSQDIHGHYLNNEKVNSLIFEKGFAFKTYEEAELACLKKLIEIVKEKP